MDRLPTARVPQGHMLGRDVSRITLGTVQLGKRYGIANRTGQPSHDEAHRIVSTALARGINAFDTARDYGDSERLLGEFLEEPLRSGGVLVVTKLPQPPAGADRAATRAHVRASVGKSLASLRLSHLPVCLLHRASDLRDPAVLDALLELRQEGIIEHLGASVYAPDEAESALSVHGFDVLQVPFNVLDQRLARSGLLRRAADHAVAIFARSVFLQGLLLLQDSAVPTHLAAVRPFNRQIAAIARDAGRSVRELALGFVAAQEGIGSVVVGVEREEQLSEIVADFVGARLEPATLEALRSGFEDVPEDLVNPSRWEALGERAA